MNAVMIDALVMGGIALALAAVAVWSWRRGRRAVGAVLGVAAGGWACVAARNLPEPVIVAGLLVVLGVVAVVTVWPLLRPGRPAGSVRGSGRGQR